MPLFGRKRRAGLRPLCYGKLPLARDFLISRGGEASRAFQQWLNHLDRTGSPATLPYRVRVLYRPPSGEHIVLATLWDSSDAGGVRRFPFSLYVEVAVSHLHAREVEPLLFALSIWEALEHVYPTLIEAESAESFHERLRQIELPEATALAASVDEAQRTEVQNLTLEALETALLEGRSASLGAGAAEAVGENGSGSVLLPLTGEIPYHTQAARWLRFMRDRCGPHYVPTMILPRESDPRESDGGTAVSPALLSLALLGRSPRQSDVQLLQGVVGQADVVSLTTGGGRGEGGGDRRQ